MTETGNTSLRKILTFASIVEVATGLALLIAPRFVVMLLVGESAPVGEIPMGRLPGIAILALGLACWPGRPGTEPAASSLVAMLVYNLLIALFLAYLFLVGHLGGVLLWPAVALHLLVALLLIWMWGRQRASGVYGT